jgi:putative DNA methylase
MLIDLVQWDSAYNDALLKSAYDEIAKSSNGNPPKVVDPFAGGGAIPMEAQRLGLKSYASDLNPVAVLLNKALIEFPPTFKDLPPVAPNAASTRLDWSRAQGLAEDIRRYGEMIREEAIQQIGHIYPKVHSDELGAVSPISWVWTRTVVCPNPACGIRMPLLSTRWLSRKKGREAYVVPEVIDSSNAPGGMKVAFSVSTDPSGIPSPKNDGTVGKTGARCLACHTSVPLSYLRSEGKSSRLGVQLMAIVASGNRKRIYFAPNPRHEDAANVERPRDAPTGELPEAALGFRVQGYGMKEWSDLYSDRQLLALNTFAKLIGKIRDRVVTDALDAGMESGASLMDGGRGAEAYADAVTIYLSLALSRLADWSNTLCRWESKGQVSQQLFGRQSVTMTWDFSEANTLASSSGSYDAALKSVARALDLSRADGFGAAEQANAARRSYEGLVIATDPPYYDNIGYAALSDLFYVWLRKILRPTLPDLFSTMLVPKADELVAEPFRHNGEEHAEEFFESGFRSVFGNARASVNDEHPITVFYAFKQAELEKEGVASTGWSTFLEGMVQQGWMITATWPVRSEMESRMRGQGANALASSIVLALRPRKATAPTTDRTGFLVALHTELEEALPRIREGAIAPADLRQTILGPGMAVFSRFSRVLEDDGSTMSVKTALALINQTFDALQNEHDAELDADTRFCLDWFRSYGWDTRLYGDAESLAVPLGLSVEGIARGGILTSGGGKVALIKPQDLDPRWDPAHDDRLSLWEVTCHLARAYATEGREEAARLMAGVKGKVDLDEVNRLATRLYELMESQDASTAGLFNGLGGAWADVSATSTTIRPAAVAETLFGEEI